VASPKSNAKYSGHKSLRPILTKRTAFGAGKTCGSGGNDRAKLIRILSLAKSAIRHNMASELPKLKMPVCLIWGKQDTITPPELAEEFHTLIPQSELFWIDHCGHAAMMEQPAEFNGILEEWLGKTLIG
jgi:pimeloyl-ACP methyl ester carboxylesterase